MPENKFGLGSPLQPDVASVVKAPRRTTRQRRRQAFDPLIRLKRQRATNLRRARQLSALARQLEDEDSKKAREFHTQAQQHRDDAESLRLRLRELS